LTILSFFGPSANVLVCFSYSCELSHMH
jgi:hypothetical protein